MSEEITFRIKGCARCGEDHMDADLVAHSFDRKPPRDEDGDEPTHWAECPVSKDPIMVYTGDDTDE